MAEKKESWQEKGAVKLQSINDSIPKAWRLPHIPSAAELPDVSGQYLHQFLSQEEISITETDATGIVRKTTSGQWTAEQVAKAFCHRASLAHQFTHCLHETFFDAAIEDAKKLDKYFSEHKRPIGPLHGLPVSLKDQFHVKGVETSMGYVGWIGTFEGRKGTGKEKVFESQMTKEFRALGAVLYCKTATPHSLMSGETVNHIIGYALNPKNRALSPGGSSGGECALIALKGSPLGIGTDLGGSIRMPAAFCGLYGLRPCVGRLPYEGLATSMDGQSTVLTVLGPMAPSVQAVKLATESLLSQQPWLHDPLVIDLPWRQDKYDAVLRQAEGPGQLAFGIMRHDGAITPHPPVRRAMEMVVQTIERMGHLQIEWKPPSHKTAYDLALTAWTFDGGRDIHGALELSGEKVSTQIGRLYGSGPVEQADATKIAETNVAKRQYQKEYMEYWNSTASETKTGRPVDAFIFPVAPYAGVKPTRNVYYGYCAALNTLDYTVCVVPVTRVDKDIDKPDHDLTFKSDLDKDIHADYDPNVHHGLPVAVQIVGRRLQEEKVLALAEYLSIALRQI